MNKDKQKALDGVLKGINKKFGEGTVTTAAKAADKLTKRVIKTSSVELNVMLGGGFTGIVELFGPERSGKTSVTIETIAVNQKEDPDFVAAWLETEGSVTKEILESHNVDLNRVVYLGQEDVGNAESAMDILRSLIESGTVDMVVLNSVAGLSPTVDIESELIKQNVAPLARLMAKFLRVITGQCHKNKICVVFINQIREKVGVLFGSPETTTGGRALAFYADQKIRLNKIKLEKSDPVAKEDGMKVSCITYKNRLIVQGNPYKECSYYVVYKTGINNVFSIPNILKNAGLISISGAWFTYIDNATGKPMIIDGIECRWNGTKAFVSALESSETLCTYFKDLAESNCVSRDLAEEEINKIKEEEAKAEEEVVKILEEEKSE